MRRLLRLVAAIRCEATGHQRAVVVTIAPTADGDGVLRLTQLGHEHTCTRCKATFPCPGGGK